VGAAEWYDAREPGLGLAFVDAVIAGIEAIVARPTAWQRDCLVAGREVRRFVLARFPFLSCTTASARRCSSSPWRTASGSLARGGLASATSSRKPRRGLVDTWAKRPGWVHGSGACDGALAAWYVTQTLNAEPRPVGLEPPEVAAGLGAVQACVMLYATEPYDAGETALPVERIWDPSPEPPLAALPPELNAERLTWAEICARYPNQWVVLVAVEATDPMLSGVRSAIVAGHGGNEESFDRAEPHRAYFRSIAHLHTRSPDPPRAWGEGDVACRSPR